MQIIYLDNIYFFRREFYYYIWILIYFCTFLIILSRFAFLIANFFFTFCFNLFSKYSTIKLLVLYALLYYLDILL